MRYKVIADSSSNLFEFPGLNYASVPLKIISGDKEYVDAPGLDVPLMVQELKKAKCPTTTSCPNVHDWTEALQGADFYFAITITSNLSGCCSAAMQAAFGRDDVFVIDTLSTGPEMQLIIEKIRDCIDQGDDFQTIRQTIRDYMTHTHLLFSLESLTNLARNGRVKPAVAKIAGVLGIRLLGRASDMGTLEPLHKCRGEQKALATILEEMKATGYQGGKVRIAHCMNLTASQKLQGAVRDEFPAADIEILPCTALCSFYAEQGGLLIGYEAC